MQQCKGSHYDKPKGGDGSGSGGGGKCPADVNKSGKVDIEDLLVLLSSYGKKC